MPSETSHLKQFLELDPEGGVIRFSGQRALLLDAVAMGVLRKYLVDNFGYNAARAVLTQFGFAHGWRMAEAMDVQIEAKNAEERRSQGLRMLTLQGLFSTTPPTADPMAKAGVMVLASYEAEQHIL